MEEKIKELENKLKEKDKQLRSAREDIDRLSFVSENATKRLQSLRLQDSSSTMADSSSASNNLGSVFGTLLSSATGSTEEMNRLKQDMQVLQEELEKKIKENQTLHIKVFDEKESYEKIVKTLQEKSERESARAKMFEDEAIARSSETEILNSENSELQGQISENKKLIGKMSKDVMVREKHAGVYYRDLVSVVESIQRSRIQFRMVDVYSFQTIWPSFRDNHANEDTLLKLFAESDVRWSRSRKHSHVVSDAPMDAQTHHMNARSEASHFILAQFEADNRCIHVLGKVNAAATCLVGDQSSKLNSTTLPKNYLTLFQSVGNSFNRIYYLCFDMFMSRWLVKENTACICKEIAALAEAFHAFAQSGVASSLMHNLESIQQSLNESAKLLAAASDSAGVSAFVDQVSKVSSQLKGFGVTSTNTSSKVQRPNQQENQDVKASKNPFAPANAESVKEEPAAAENGAGPYSLSMHIRTDGMKNLANWIGLLARSLHESVSVRTRHGRSHQTASAPAGAKGSPRIHRNLLRINQQVKRSMAQQKNEGDELRKEIQKLQASLARAQKQALKRNNSAEGNHKETASAQADLEKSATIDETIHKDQQTGMAITLHEEDTEDADNDVGVAVRVVNTRSGKESDQLEIKDSEYDLVYELERQIQYLKEQLSNHSLMQQ